MRYSVEQRDRVYVKGYGFLSFAKNMGKSLSNKYSRKLIDSAKKSATDDKITSGSKKSNNNSNNNNNNNNKDVELTTHKKRYISRSKTANC